MNIKLQSVPDSQWYLIEGDFKGTLEFNDEYSNFGKREIKTPIFRIRDFEGNQIKEGFRIKGSWNDEVLEKRAKRFLEYHLNS